MVDGEDRQHRPRTTRALAKRAKAVARAAGGDPGNYHEAVRLAVDYLAVAVDGPLECPHCGEGRLEMHRDGFFRCDRGACVAAASGHTRVPWYQAVGLPSDAEVSDPRSDGGTARRLSTAFE